MARDDLVRPSRDGDQFHYHWAARQCLSLLPGSGDLVAVTVEGPSSRERTDQAVEDGDELIDVGLYHGAEELEQARLVRYVQLKHSTRNASSPWTASGIKKTVIGFAERYASLLKIEAAPSLEAKIQFVFASNRPMAPALQACLKEIRTGIAPSDPELRDTLVQYTGLGAKEAADFFRLFSLDGGEPDLWTQRNLLFQDMRAYLAEADYDAPIQLKELVTRKATSEAEKDPAIRLYDVLRALKVALPDLFPAPSQVNALTEVLPREQEDEIRRAVLDAVHPVVVHADGGVGKSMLALRLASTVATGSEAVLYDCFGDGLYRNPAHFRHRHRDAFVQIANHLASKGLCHPLIPSTHVDVKQYMRAFCGRLAQAIALLKGRDPDASLILLIDAADNAEMAAEEVGEVSFVRDLIRAQLPLGVRLVFTCRTHRLWRLSAPPDAINILLRPFSTAETGRHLRRDYPSATDADVVEFGFLSSSNPRVQALALDRKAALNEMLAQLGPTPTTVERAIGDLLRHAVDRLRDAAGAVDGAQIDLICQGLAVLRPLVPISLLASLSGTSDSAVRSFALDLGRPLLVKGDSLHFLDEPAETWFRETFQPDSAGVAKFLDRLRPLAEQSSYAAAALPQFLLGAGRLNELVDLALSSAALPNANPIERRDVELQRLTFALQACLRQRNYLAASKLALKAGGESAGETRQNRLIQENTDVAARLLPPDRVEEIVSRRTFKSTWMGSRHAYDAGLLSGRAEFEADARSRLRMAIDWLRAWARLSPEDRSHEEVSDADRLELAMAMLRLRGPDEAAKFLRGWSWRLLAFRGAKQLARRLVDLGEYKQLDLLAIAAGNDVWMLLGLVNEARKAHHLLPPAPIGRLIRLLCDRRVQLSESTEWNANWDILYSVQAAVATALRVLTVDAGEMSALLKRYLPEAPPSILAERFGFDRAPMVRAYALEAALRGQQLQLVDVAPAAVRPQLVKGASHGQSQEVTTFEREVGGVLPWSVLSAEIACGRVPADLIAALDAAVKETAAREANDYQKHYALRQMVALEWLSILREFGIADGPLRASFETWINSQEDKFWDGTLSSLCHQAARAPGLDGLAVDFASRAFGSLEASRENAETRASSYLELARAILPASPGEASVYFNRAVEISSRIGDENLDRWTALLHLAQAARDPDTPRPEAAYRLSRIAELTYEYVDRDKHFDWEGTVNAIVDLSGPSALSILSRWRDRRFGRAERLLPLAVHRLVEQGRLPAVTPVALAGFNADWSRLRDIETAVSTEADPGRRTLVLRLGYRYMRVQVYEQKTWQALTVISQKLEVELPDLSRLVSFTGVPPREAAAAPIAARASVASQAPRRTPDWDEIFEGVDLFDPGSIRSAYAKIKTYDPPYEFSEFFADGLRRAGIGRASEFVAAVSAWADFDTFHMYELLGALPWDRVSKLVSLRNQVRQAVLNLCRREPLRTTRRGWGAFLPFEKLAQANVVADGEIVPALLEGYAAQTSSLSGGELFLMLDPLATTLSPKEAEEALDFGLSLLEDVLRPEDGDGPWHERLQPPPNCASALAGYIWAGLGSPIAGDRWEFAHVVRTCVELGWSDVVAEIAALASTDSTDSSSAFVDSGLEFYEWHARQWLLAGLARGSMDNPAGVAAAVPLLRLSLLKPHVIIRGLAAQTLQTLAKAGMADDVDLSALAAINASTLPVENGERWWETNGVDTFVDDNPSENDESYLFGIDIEPYWFAPLGRAFGLNANAVTKRARVALREQLKWSGDRSDERYKRKVFGGEETSHSHGTRPRTDDSRAYRAHHLLMLVAASLLKERSVRQNPEEPESEFQEWLDAYLVGRNGGRWLADRLDPRLLAAPQPPEGYADKSWRWRVTAQYLDQQLRTDDGLYALWGQWESGHRNDHESVSLRSALVSRSGAESLVAALQTAPEPGWFFLPGFEQDESKRTTSLELKGWVSNGHPQSHPDELDAWAKGIQYPGPAPCEQFVSKLGLVASADGRTWSGSLNELARSETWTHVVGSGREQDTVSGTRLSANLEFLRCILQAHPDDCLVLSVTVRRRAPEHEEEKSHVDAYQWPYVRYYLLDKDGQARTL